MMADINVPDGDTKFWRLSTYIIIIIIIVIDLLHYYSQYYCTLLPQGFRIEILRDFSLFTFDFKYKNWPSTWCASTANIINSDTDIFKGRSVSVNMTG
jgi:hypothetical protein